ncbi:toprim domain-containing protein [Methylomonas rhizoryzae]|uniref:toprim domain-containing protein n=1 Tax=Methylomonas rhizoryzae TaxID=2608981 RepID=UPI0012319979|nr:toprim domain-containing protein [Methylomonas rhizoryzae]
MTNAFEIVDQFKAAMLDAGIEPPPLIQADGVLHRFYIAGHKKGSLNGAYKLHLDGAKPAGYFEDFKNGVKTTWKAGGPVLALTLAERTELDAARRQREAELAAKRDQVAAIARREYRKARAWPFEPTGYMVRKQLPSAHCAKRGRFDRRVRCVDGVVRRLVVDGVLLVPVLDRAECIRNIQYIFDLAPPQIGRDKTFIAGGELGECFCRIGAPSDTVFLVEGFADAVSLHADTGCRVYIAFSAGNLPAVALIVRELHPQAAVIVCRDNDDVGGRKADEAAALVGGKVYAPPFGKDYSDWFVEQRRLERERG